MRVFGGSFVMRFGRFSWFVVFANVSLLWGGDFAFIKPFCEIEVGIILKS